MTRAIPRRNRAQSRARLALKWERVLSADLARTIDRIGSAVASRAGDRARAEAAIDRFGPAIERLIVLRSEQCARAFVDRTLTEVRSFGRKSAAPIEHKRTEGTRTRAEQAASRFIRERAGRMIADITRSMRETLRRALDRGLREGRSEPEIARSVERAFRGNASRARAQRIARTEIHTASNAGSIEAARATELDLVKVWGATEDERTRPSHARADGQSRELDKPFRVGGAALDYPGDPKGPPGETINCRCTMLFELRKARKR